MKIVTFEIVSVLKFELDIVKFEKISSKVGWVQNGIDLAEKHFPKIIDYLSKQSIIANLKDRHIIIESDKERSEKFINRLFSVWIRKERVKRRILVAIESILIPFTAVLALLPGPNFFFYIPALFLYYHWKSLQGLRKIDLDNLILEIRFVDHLDTKGK